MTAPGERLVQWYRANRRIYPWRTTRDPYRIWVSEILLQQTQISVVIPFYEKIIERYPSFEALATADPSEFLSLWSGIGYYRRAENMLLCARQVVRDHGGSFPVHPAQLRRLAGIGSYTAGAIRNLCFDLLTPAVDGNVRRVLARITGCQKPSSGKEFHAVVESAFLKHGCNQNAGEYFQGLMELGQRVCLPAPNCPSCPVRPYCVAASKGITRKIPAPSASAKTVRLHWYFFLMRNKSAFYFVRNSQRAFLKNVWLFPDLLSERLLTPGEIKDEVSKRWEIDVQNMHPVGRIAHAVTFRRITGHVYDVAPGLPPAGGLWLTPAELHRHHTSSVARKILSLL
jgi:A/G-specific adenine glycosylase